MAITIARSLNIYPADLTSKYPSSDLSGLVVLRIRSKYQLLISAGPENGGLQYFPLDSIFSPEICICFIIPTTFLVEQETAESYVENTLLELGLGLDDSATKFLAPKIAEFTMEVAERRDTGKMEQGFATVADVLIEKADFLHKEELSRIASDSKAECGMCVDVDDPNFFSGFSEFAAEINDHILSY